jgi:hypothetical protein
MKKRIKVSHFERQNFKDEKNVFFFVLHILYSHKKSPTKIIIIPEKEDPFE